VNPASPGYLLPPPVYPSRVTPAPSIQAPIPKKPITGDQKVQMLKKLEKQLPQKSQQQMQQKLPKQYKPKPPIQLTPVEALEAPKDELAALRIKNSKLNEKLYELETRKAMGSLSAVEFENEKQRIYDEYLKKHSS
jgi:flagellar motor protein MotB